MFWTRISKALSDIIMVVALVMALMLGEGFYKMLDSVMAGVVGFVIGLVITFGAAVALKSLGKTSDSIIHMLNKLEGQSTGNIIPSSIEDVELIERIDSEKGEEGDNSEHYDLPSVNVRWRSLSGEIKAVWIECIAFVVATLVLAYRVSEKTQYGAILILGFGLVTNMLINAILGTAVENHHKMERVNYLMKTRNERKRNKTEMK